MMVIMIHTSMDAMGVFSALGSSKSYM